MKVEEILTKDGYTGTIKYHNECMEYPASKKYSLTIEKAGKLFINQFGLTCSGAKTKFNRWVNKQNK